MAYGSALGQDRWVIDEVFGGRRGGFFVEAGALNGEDESNTVILEREYDWRGICVEPHTPYFNTLRHKRACIAENLCLYDRETEVEFLAAGGHGGIPKHFNASYDQSGRRSMKPALPLATLLERHQAPKEIDYLSLDTEGTEYLILKAFPFDRYRFNAMTIEHNHDPELRDNLRTLLARHDYVRCRTVLVDDWWLHRSVFEKIDADRRKLWELLDRFPPAESAIRHAEIAAKYKHLLTQAESATGSAALFWRAVRKSARRWIARAR